jgi:Na+/glutamate symporter
MVWLAAVVHGILLYCLLFYFPLYFAARGYGPVRVGLALLPYTLTTGIAAVITGICLSRIRTYRIYAWAGWGVTTLGMGLMLLLRTDSHGAVWVMVSIVGGAGLGASWSATLTAAQAASDENVGQSSASMFGFLRAIGQAAGVALGGGLFQNALKIKIAQHPDHAMYAGAWAKDAAALIRVIHQLASPSDQDLRLVLVTAFVDALRIVFLCLCVLSAIVTVTLLIWLRDITPTRGLRVEKFVVDGTETTMRTVAYRTS